MTQESLTAPSRAPEGWAAVSAEGAAALASPHGETRLDRDALRAGLSDEKAARILAESNSGVRPDLSRRGYRFAKRAFDVAASGAAVAALFVPALALCAAICLKSPGAGPLYSQLRVGRVNPDGTYRLFRMWKFRSMVPNADRMLDGLRESNEADGPFFILKTRQVFFGETKGAFALPATEVRTKRAVFPQVKSLSATGLRTLRRVPSHSTAIFNISSQFLVKRVFKYRSERKVAA